MNTSDNVRDVHGVPLLHTVGRRPDRWPAATISLGCDVELTQPDRLVTAWGNAVQLRDHDGKGSNGHTPGIKGSSLDIDRLQVDDIALDDTTTHSTSDLCSATAFRGPRSRQHNQF